MSKLNENNHLVKYFKIVDPSEIEISEDNIFYRDEYKEIIEYLKLLLTESEDLEIYNFIKPKGALLINIFPGTDLIDYLKLISCNYYINLVQLKESEIRNNPTDFFDNLIVILNNFDKLIAEKIQSQEIQSEKKQEKVEQLQKKKKLFIINQKRAYRDIFEGKNLLMELLTHYQEEEHLNSLLNNNFVLIWINYDYNEIIDYEGELFKIFDYFIRIPRLNKLDRQEVLRKFMEKNPEIVFELNAIVEKTNEWEVKEIKQLIKIAILKHYLNSELTTTSNEITDSIIQIIENGEYIPAYKKQALSQKKGSKFRKMKKTEEILGEKPIYDEEGHVEISSNINIKEILDEIKEKNYSKFMLEQLYQNAASENFNELVIIIDKLDKNEPLEDNDRKILAEYPFILNDNPSRAQINLEKAKKRIDTIKKSFGK